jgi:hypothetical protein
MSDGSEDGRDWSGEERRALGALAEGPEPPAALEDATVRRLAEAGLLGRRRAGWRVRLAAAAAALALFALGVAVGSRRGSPGTTPASGTPRFVLLLYDAPDEKALTDAQMEARVAEYRSWARGVRASGREIAGEKLEPQALPLGPPEGAGTGWPLGGYFVISAKDLDAAVDVARSCPHLKHGGRVEVRAIART